MKVKKSETKLPLRYKSKYFSTGEMLYLFSRYQKYSKGKTNLKVKRLLQGCKEKNAFFGYISSFDRDDDSSLEFEEFLELIGVLSRSTLQKRLAVLFDALSNDNEKNILTKMTFFTKMQELVSNDTQKDLQMIFKDKKKLKKDQFILNCFNNKTIFSFLERLEKQISKYTDKMEKKHKASTIKYPLDRTNEIEDTEVPASISAICMNLDAKMKKNAFKLENELHTLNKEEMKFCESIVNAIGGGYIDDIDFSEVPFIILLNALRVILKSLPETLFTQLISKKLLSVEPESIEVEKILKKVLNKIPRCNYKSIKCVASVFHDLFLTCPPKTSHAISSFFLCSFFNAKNQQETKNASFYLKFLCENVNELFVETPSEGETTFSTDTNSDENSFPNVMLHTMNSPRSKLLRKNSNTSNSTEIQF